MVFMAQTKREQEHNSKLEEVKNNIIKIFNDVKPLFSEGDLGKTGVVEVINESNIDEPFMFNYAGCEFVDEDGEGTLYLEDVHNEKKLNAYTDDFIDELKEEYDCINKFDSKEIRELRKMCAQIGAEAINHIMSNVRIKWIDEVETRLSDIKISGYEYLDWEEDGVHFMLDEKTYLVHPWDNIIYDEEGNEVLKSDK